MKKPILKNSDYFWGTLFSICLILIPILATTIIFIFDDGFDIGTIIMLAISLVIMLITGLVFLVIAPKIFVSKVMINGEGIEWSLYKKQLNFFDWKDIKGIYAGHGYRMRVIYFDLSPSNEEFYIKINRKRLKLFIRLCPIQELKEQLQRIKVSFWKIK